MNELTSAVCISACFLLQFLFAAARYEKNLEDSAWKRALGFLSLLCGFAGFLLLMDISCRNLWLEKNLWAMVVLFLLDMAICGLLQYLASLVETKWLYNLGAGFGRFFAALLKFIPLPKEKEPEKEIIFVKDENTQQVLENAIELTDKSIDEICTHRSEVISLSLKDSPAKWRQTILENRHTFYPVTNENGDDVVGVLDTRDYFRLPSLSREAILKNTVDKPLFVAENTRSDELIHQMKSLRNYFAIVLDEYGGMTGIITAHDIMEELLGEMAEPEDAGKAAEIVKLPKGVWRIAGSADLDDVSRALGEKLELDDFETFSGYILGTIGYIPPDDTQLQLEIGDLEIQVKAIKNHRIRQTLVRKKTPAPDSSQNAKAKPQPAPGQEITEKKR